MKKTDVRFKQKLEEIKLAIEPTSLLSSLGFEVTKESSDELRACCIIHGGDNQTAFRFKKETKTFSCYSHSCHDNGSDVFSLVMAVKRCSFKDALQFLSNETGIPLDLKNISLEETERLYSLNSLRKLSKEIDFDKRIHELDELSQLDWLNNHIKDFVNKRTSYFQQRGFSKETLDLFEIGTTNYFSEGKRATIPIRDELGSLVGVSSRLESDIEYTINVPKYRNLKSFNKENYLYNLDKAKEYVEFFNDTLILVEGYTGVWKLWQAGIPIAVATMGTSLSDIQRHYLCKHCLRCIIMFDGDKAGEIGAKKIEKSLKNFVQVVSFSQSGKEPSTFSVEELVDITSKLIYI